METIVPSLDHDAKIEEVAANPITFGGALMLLAADNVTQAADLQKAVCNILLYPRKYCGFTTGDTVGPLFHRLTVDTTDAVGQWLLEQTVPVASGPLGLALTALPDMLCRMPPTTLAKIPQEMRWDLVRARAGSGPIKQTIGRVPACVLGSSPCALIRACYRQPRSSSWARPATPPGHPTPPLQCPYDVSALPVMTMFVMGRTGSGNLHAKLCDVLTRPQEACKNGKYHVSAGTPAPAGAPAGRRRWGVGLELQRQPGTCCVSHTPPLLARGRQRQLRAQ